METQENGFKLSEGRFKLDIGKKILPYEGGDAQAQVSQRSCGYPNPGSVQGTGGRGLGHPGTVGGKR